MDPLAAIATSAVPTVINDLFYSPADKFRDQLKSDQAKAALQASADVAKAKAQAQADQTKTIAMYALIGVGVLAGSVFLFKALS